jgi:hypothetical protein
MRHFCHRSNAALIRFRILVRTPVGFSVEIPFSALLKIFLSQVAIFVGSALGPGPFFRLTELRNADLGGGDHCLLPFLVSFFCFLVFQCGFVTAPQDCVVGPQPALWLGSPMRRDGF